MVHKVEIEASAANNKTFLHDAAWFNSTEVM